MKIKELLKKEISEYKDDYLIESNAMNLSSYIGDLLDEKICQLAAKIAGNRNNLKKYSVTDKMVPRIEEQDILSALDILIKGPYCSEYNCEFYKYLKENEIFND